MTAIQAFFDEKRQMPHLNKNLLSKFPDITTDPEIQNGWPIINGTRVMAFDIFKAIVKGYSLPKIQMQFKEMDVNLSLEQLNQAFYFSLDWIHSLNAKRKTKISR